MTPRVCKLFLDGTEVRDDVYRDVNAIEVIEHAAEPAAFAVRLSLVLRPDGTYHALDDDDADTFAPWRRLTIQAGFGDAADVLVDGYIGGLTPHFGRDDAESSLIVWGHDAAYAMDQEEKIVAWGDRKYSDIAVEIFKLHGLEADVADTQVLHAVDDAMMLQRSSDWSFLKHLAERVGYEVYVRGARGYFRPPTLTATPQADLALRFGAGASNLVWFKPQMSSDMPTQISVARADPLSKRVQRVTVEESPQHPLGGDATTRFREGRSAPGAPRLIVRHQPVGSQQEMEALAAGVRRRTDWAVTGEGEIDGRRYGRSLRARETVLIKGLGRTFSGAYYVTEVLHHLTRTEYRQRFKAQRNAVTVVGNESFTDAPQPGEGAAAADERRPPIVTRLAGKVVAP